MGESLPDSRRQHGKQGRPGRRFYCPGVGIVILWGILMLGSGCRRADPKAAQADGVAYTSRTPSPGGTGRVFMGREIASFLDETHRASWLERPDREDMELPGRIIQALELHASDFIADIGAGTGYLTFRLSRRVPSGRVYAVDIDPVMIDTLRARKARYETANVVPVLGAADDPHLPPGMIDLALIVASYHEFSHPYEMLRNIREALKPGGRLVIVEYRGEDDTIPVPPLHRMTAAQVRRELAAAGFRWRESRDFLPQQHFMVFEKPAP